MYLAGGGNQATKRPAIDGAISRLAVYSIQKGGPSRTFTRGGAPGGGVSLIARMFMLLSPSHTPLPPANVISLFGDGEATRPSASIRPRAFVSHSVAIDRPRRPEGVSRFHSPSQHSELQEPGGDHRCRYPSSRAHARSPLQIRLYSTTNRPSPPPPPPPLPSANVASYPRSVETRWRRVWMWHDGCSAFVG